MNTLLGFGCVGLIIAFLWWFGLRQARKGAIDRFKVNEQESIKKVQRALNDLRVENDKLPNSVKRSRLFDKYSRD